MEISGVGRMGSTPPPSSPPSLEDLQKLISGSGSITSVQDAMKVIQALMEALEKDEAAVQAGGGTVDTKNPYYEVIQKEINNLKDLVSSLKDALPLNSPDRAKLDTILQQLTKISTPPTLDELKALPTILTDLMKIGLTLPTTPIDQQRLFWEKMTTMFTDLKTFTQGAIATIDSEIAKLQEELKTLTPSKDQAKIELINKELMDKTISKGELINAVFVFDSVKTLAQICSTNNLSLPDKFKEAILDVFMPAQEKILAQYAGELYYCNFSIRIYNQLSGITNTFNSADTIFSVSAEFRARFPSTNVQGQDRFTGTIGDARALFQKELADALTAQQNVQKAIDQIDASIDDINKDTTLTNEQKKELTDKLTAIKSNLEYTFTSPLSFIIGFLRTGTVSILYNVPNSNPPAFTMMDGSSIGLAVLANWSRLENDLINGSVWPPDAPRRGGLKVIANNINTDRTDYSNVSDQAQLEVTNAMTKIQQQWTIVATSLQLLNQMYMGLARGIRGG